MTATDLPVHDRRLPVHDRRLLVYEGQWWACERPEAPWGRDVAYDERCRACRLAAQSHLADPRGAQEIGEHNDFGGNRLGDITLTEWCEKFPP